MINSFKSDDARQLFIEGSNRKLPNDIHRVATRKLFQLHAATEVSQLAVPPGNQLEKLKDDRKGQYSIRINDQWRICFEWKDGNAEQVEIVDYH